jgi:hypothetical protein
VFVTKGRAPLLPKAASGKPTHGLAVAQFEFFSFSSCASALANCSLSA